MDNVGMFYGRLEYFRAYWYIYVIRPFGIVCCHLVFYPRFGILFQEKSGNPGLDENVVSTKNL
jgi:hypothetical protein